MPDDPTKTLPSPRLPFATKGWLGAMYALSAAFLLLRFAALEADFPRGITASRALFTDEGWYAGAAIQQTLTGSPHVEGGFNTAPLLPVWPLLLWPVWAITGMSFASARALHALLVVGLIAATGRLAWRRGRLAAALTVLLLSTNYFLFAYSRLALLDLPMLFFVVLALLSATSERLRGRWSGPLLSAGFLFLGVLTKTTALFALPVLLFALWQHGARWREVAVCAGLAAVLVVAHQMVAWRLFPEDMAFFRQLNFQDRFALQPVPAFQRLLLGGWKALVADPLLFGGGAALAGSALVLSKAFRRDPLVRLSLMWVASYAAVLAMTLYQPPRYFLPLFVPAALLIAAAAQSFLAKRKGKGVRLAAVILILLLIGTGSVRAIAYVADLHYTFRDAAAEIRRVAEQDHGAGSSAVVLGEMASTLALETHLPGLPPLTSAAPLERLISRYNPAYYVALGSEPAVMAALEKRYRVQLVRQFAVFGNYHNGDAAYLYRLLPR